MATIPVDRIAAEARQVNLARVLLVMLSAPFYALGWMAGKTFLVLAWAGLAVKAGWQDSRRERTTGGPAR